MRLSRKRIRSELLRLRSWRLRGRQISRLFVFDTFQGGIRFVNRVAKIADKMNHHPDITIRYNKVKLSLTTHDEGGLTIKDFKLAHKIDEIICSM